MEKMREIKVMHIDAIDRIVVDRYLTHCSVCNTNIEPVYIGGVLIRSRPEKDSAELAFQCTNIECRSLLIGYYVHGDERVFHYQKTQPVKPTNKVFEEEVEEVSPNFVEIYNQSYHSEQMELHLISGIGYRKALEFLVKDYLIYLKPEDKEEILNEQLSPCINMLDNHTIKEIARRASWLGNDEAHYLRKWEDKDIEDLKKLIEVTVYFIAMDIAGKKYLEEMER
ncbi:DUF4145 domain-containing protein [Oceanobacillus indicireducens]|uniref:DUF4145 domain-containing protein n=1 Tax=Oceanobacillus indicireducens TaxID=1004261 RepID=A0A918D5D2_9BACI|nr:DUF4145 domain-containing protein [Oceanobacillus indicireducens]GGN67678.1 hypothetical protein GCM10007971_38730 [Oceanobacillus indicireducens]